MIFLKLFLLIIGIAATRGANILLENDYNRLENYYMRICEQIIPLLLNGTGRPQRNFLPALIFAQSSGDVRNAIAKYFHKISYQVSFGHFVFDDYKQEYVKTFCDSKSDIIILYNLDQVSVREQID